MQCIDCIKFSYGTAEMLKCVYMLHSTDEEVHHSRSGAGGRRSGKLKSVR